MTPTPSPVRTPFGLASGPLPSTAVPLAKPENPKLGYGQTSVTIPLCTDILPATLGRVTWGILLARYTSTEQVAFGYAQIPASPLDPEAVRKALVLCTLRINADTSLAVAVDDPRSSTNQPPHLSEWTLPVDYSGQLATVLITGNGQPQESESSSIIGQDALNILAATTRTTLAVSCQVVRGSLTVRMAFDQSQVAEAAVEEFAHQFCTVARALTEAAADPEQLAGMYLGEVAWVNQTEVSRLLQFAGTISHPDAVNTPVHLFVGKWVGRIPEGIALDHQGRTVTYAQFDRMTSALARILVRDHGAQPEARIALLLPKSIGFIVALFAVLKSGAAYVPIDPEYPEERIRYIIEDSRATLVLADYETQGRLGNLTCPKLLVSNVAEALPCTEDNACPFVAHHSEPTDLAYIVYTSGTTGQPKGVMVEHGSLVSLTVDPKFDRYYGPGQRDLLVMSVGFDAMLWPTMKTLCNGGTLVLPGPDLLGDLSSVHTASVTPSFLAKLHPEQFPLLRGIFCGGEPCNQRLVNTWRPHCGLHNGYGPTETTVVSLTAILHVDDMITVGRPLRNVLAYIVDDDLHLVPVGAPGQLLIGGLGVARGYCNRPELTAQRFIANPFGPGRVYLTGDRARWLPSGQVDLLGRLDHQIKLRGFRIELEEVEATATSFPAVQLAVAAVQKDRLILFVESQSVDTIALLEYLRTHLAKFMVPDQVVPVTQLPLTANGKVDRKALPEVAEPLLATPPTEPLDLTGFELRLRDAWAQILQLPAERISAADDFFRIGGDSISAILLVSKCQQLGYKATVPLIYECRQLRTLAARLTPLAAAASEADQGQVQGPVDLTPIQRWFFSLPFRNPHHFNQSFTLRAGLAVTLDAVGSAFGRLADHHDILRARFRHNGEGVWEQFIPSAETTPDDFSITEVTVAEGDYADLILQVQSSLNLIDGPIMAACLVHSSDRPHQVRLFWTIHHVLVDLVSWRVLIEDLQTLLTGGRLPPKTLSFQAWCSQLDDYARTLRADAWPVQHMAVDNRQLLPPPQALAKSDTPARLSVSYEFDRTFTDRLLLQLTTQWRVTPRDLLLASFAWAYCQTLGTAQVSFVMEGHGREPWSDAMDVCRTVGWFTALYPLVLDIPVDSSVLAALRHAKETLQQIPNRGFPYSLLRSMPGVDPVERSKLLAKTPAQIDVQFNYFGRFGGPNSDDEALGVEWDDYFGLHDFAPGEHAIYDLNPMPLVNRDRLRLVMEYNPRVYGSTIAQQLLSRWRQGLEELADTPAASIQPLLTRFDAPLLQPTALEFDALTSDLGRRGVATANVEDILPCTPMQGGLLAASLKDPTAYVVQAAVTLSGFTDLTGLRQAWEAIVLRHGILRTIFVPTAAARSNGFAQVVLRQVTPAWTVADGCLASLAAFFRSNRAQGFDGHAPMVRVHIFPTDEPDQSLLVLSVHHALVDGWSFPILLQDLCWAYTSAPGVAQAPPVAFCSVVEAVDGQDTPSAQAFWTEYLKGARPTPAPMLHPDWPREPAFAELALSLDVAKVDLVRTAQRNGVSLSILTRAALALVLGRCLGQDDLTVGFVMAGRNLDVPGITQVVGPCINTVPLRFLLGHQPLGEWLASLQSDATRMIPFEHTSLAQVKGWCNPGKATPLFNVLAGYENFPQLTTRSQGVSARLLKVHEFTEYPLTIDFVEEADALGVKVFYQQAHYTAADITRLVGWIACVLAQFMTIDPCTPLDRLPVAQPPRDEESSGDHPASPLSRPDDYATVIRELMNSLAARSDERAVRSADGDLTYGQLLRAASDLALRLSDAQPERPLTVVAVVDGQIALATALLVALQLGLTLVVTAATDPLETVLGHAVALDAAHLIVPHRLASALSAWPLPGGIVLTEFPSSTAPPILGADPPGLAVEVGGGSYGARLVTSPPIDPSSLIIHDLVRGLVTMPPVAALCGSIDHPVVTHSLPIAMPDTAWVTLFALAHGLPLAWEGGLPSATSESTPNYFTVARASPASNPNCTVQFRNLVLDSRRLVPSHQSSPAFYLDYVGSVFTGVNVVGAANGQAGAVPYDGTASHLTLTDGQGSPCPPGMVGTLSLQDAGPLSTAESRQSPATPTTLALVDDSGVLHVLGSPGRLVTADGVQFHLSSLDRMLSARGLRSPLSVEARGGRIVTFTASSKAKLEDLSTADLPGPLQPVAILSADAYPHLSGLLEQDLVAFAEAYLYVAQGQHTALPATDSERWLAITCIAMLADEAPLLSDIWPRLLSRPPLIRRLQQRILQRFAVLLDITTLVGCSDLSMLSQVVDGGEQATAEPTPSSHGHDGSVVVRTSQLSPYQEQVWLACQLASTSGPFYHQAHLPLSPELTVSQIQGMLNHVATAVELLRTVVATEDCQPYTQVLARGNVPLEEKVGGDPSDIAAYLGQPCQDLTLDGGPLFRAYLLTEPDRVAANRFLVIRVHQILIDEADFYSFAHELERGLGVDQGSGDSFACLGPTANVPPLIRSINTSNSTSSYWEQLLADVPTDLSVPLEGRRSAVPTFRSASVEFGLAVGLVDEAATYLHKHRVLPSAIWLALVASYLGRLGGRSDVLVDLTCLSDRPIIDPGHPSAPSPATFPVRVCGISTAEQLSDLCVIITQQVYHSQDHLSSDCDPYAVLPRSQAYPLWHPVRIGLLVYTSAPKGSTVTVGQPHAAQWHDLIFHLDLSGQVPTMTIRYNPDLFKSGTIERLGANLLHYGQSSLVAAQPLLTAPLVCPAERHRLLEEFGRNPGAFDPSDVSTNVISLVRGSVQRSPGTVALESRSETMTYAEMNGRVENLAHALQTRGIQPQARVAVIVESHPATVMAMLALWLVRAVYVPVDCTLPEQRQRFMAETAQCTHVLNMSNAEVGWAAALPGLALLRTKSHTEPLPYHHCPDDLAYIIFTSGTTGQPKGVMVRHASLTNLLLAPETTLCPQPGTRYLQTMAVGFDVFILVALSPLCTSATVVYSDGDIAAALRHVYGVFITPSVMGSLNPADYPNLRRVMSAGEALPTELAAKWLPHCQVSNLYGPTEITVISHTLPVRPNEPVTIGRPIAGSECYIVDALDQLVPIGAVGEICVGGLGVSTGYVNRPDLNETKFVRLPYSAGPVYRTGDLGRWLPNGEVECLGRQDDQVKLRGFRIELSEVRGALLNLCDVQDAHVLVHERSLVAFVCPSPVEEAAVISALRRALPAYMVPSHVLGLDHVPRTVNGKADQQALVALFAAHRHRVRTELHLHVEPAPVSDEGHALASAVQDVLRLEGVGIGLHLPFLRLGGDSISAIQVSARCRQLGYHLSAPDLIGDKTLTEVSRLMKPVHLPAYSDDAAQAVVQYQPYSLLATSRGGIAGLREEAAAHLGVGSVEIEDVLPVSSLQQGFLVNTLKDPSAYMVQLSYEVTGPLDIARFHQSWSQVVQSHQVLRTKFVVPVDQSQHAFFQAVLRGHDFEWAYHDEPLDRFDEIERDHFVTDRSHGFTLSGPLTRFAIYRGTNDRHLFCFTCHHALLDAWSVDIIMAESLERYHGVQVEPRSQYRDFIRHVSHVDRAGMADFWRANLDGIQPQPIVQFPVHTSSNQARYDETHHTLSVGLPAIKQFSREMGLTVNSLLRAVWALTLAHYLGQPDEVSFGVLVSGRNLPVTGIEGMVGMCINTLPFRVPLGYSDCVADFLSNVHTSSSALTKFEQSSLVDIRRWAKLGADTDLFSSLLVYNSYMATVPAGCDQITYTARSGHNVTEYAYTVSFTDTGDDLVLGLSYRTRACDQAYADHLVRYIDYCLASLVTRCVSLLSDVMRLPPAEKSLIDRWSIGHTVDFPQRDWLAHQFFTQNLATRADAIALESATDQFTYAEVHHRACAIAAALHSQGARCGDRVALLFTRCPEFIFSYLAVLLLGGVCVPMDAKNAPDRLLYMVDLLDDPWVVTHSTTGDLVAELGLTQERALYADHILTNPTQEPKVQHPIEHTPDSLAYIVFTSGTTGQPKGVQVTHRSLTNFILAFSERFQLLPDCRFLLISNFSFDVLLLEIFGTFHAGGTLVFQDGQILDDLHRITACFLVPSLLAALEPTDYYNITHLLVGGEAFQASAAAKWFGRARLYNAYGPTEATILSHGRLMRPGDNITIGTTMANMQCHILDDQLHPVPIGRPGEICIGGAGVSEGYWRRPELTNQAFVGNPFGPGRLYRTGDVGCWLTDGEVQVLGRKDFQVKLRGFRIELGEIESTCQAFPGVANAVALVKDKRLVVYVAPTGVDTMALKEHITAKLPHYMVPDVIVALEALPLTSIGKADRRALQALELVQEAEVDDSAQLPVSETFAILRRALAETLNVDPARVTPSASFLRLGGDSISAIQFSSRCKKYGVKLTVAAILKHLTLARIDQCAELGADTSGPKFLMDPSGPVPFTAIERRILTSLRYVNHFNQSILLQCRQPLALDTLKQTVRALVVHHDILRLRLTSVDGEWSKEVLPLPTDTTTDAFLARFAAVTEDAVPLADYEGWVFRTQGSISAEHGPIMACTLLSVDERPYLYLSVHHLAIDFVSWRIILEDLETLLTGGTLPEKTLSFREWSTLANEHAQTLPDESWPSYGETALLPVDHTPPSNAPTTYRTAMTVEKHLGLELSELLYGQAAARANASPQEFMVAALVMALADVFHLPSVELDMEGHGRRPWRSDMDVSRTLGWFTSMYPVAFHLSQAECYPTLPLPLRHLAHVKQRLRSVPDSGFPYSLLKYVKGNSVAPLVSRGNPQSPAGVVFNYAGRFEQLLVQDAFLTPAHLSAGWSHDLSLDEPLGHALSTSGTYDARQGLGLSILFSTQLFDEAKVLAATSLWRSHLADLIQAAVATPVPCHTPSDFPHSGLSEVAFSTLVTRTLPAMGLDLAAVEDIYPCLPIQEGLLLATLKDPAAYMVQSAYDIRGPLEQQRMRAAWEATFQHHAVFRTRFLLGVAGTVHPNLQVITRRTEAQWTLSDWSSVDVVEAEAAFMRTQREEGFRPDQPMIRFGLFRTGPECHRLIISIHHAMIDGWSNGLFLQTFLRSYMGHEPLPTGQLHDLVSHVQNQSPAATERYWTAYFEGVDQPSLLAEPHHTADPTLLPTSANYYGRIDHVIESAGDLLRFGQTQGVTPSTLLRTAVAVVLHRYTGSDNPVFGTVVSGRNVAVPQIEAIVGPCINTIPFCAHLAKDTTVKGLLQAVHARGTSVYNFEHCRLTDIHQWSGVSRERPLFNVLFVFENYPETQAGVDLPIELLPGDVRDPTDVPLTLLAAVRGDSLGMRATFQTTSFSHAFVQQFLVHLANVLRNLAALPSDAPVYAVGMLSGDEEERLTNSWARNPVALPACSLAHDRFLARVQSDPDHDALRDGGRVYTYGQLHRMATRLAHRLHQTGGCGADQVVGILAGNSVELIVGQLAVWMTGSAFVVVAPDYPAERRRFILEDAACMAVVGTKGSLGEVPDGMAVSHVEIDPEALLCSDSTVDTPDVTIAPTSLAYIIYTSGTTGKPKGVMHEHRAVAQYLQGFIGAIGIAADDITPTLLTPTFDIATSETWLTLSVGGCLRIAQGDHKRALQQATRAAITPSLLSVFEPSDFPRLRSVILGGEPASQTLVDKWASAVRLFNWFGPTELAHGSHLVELNPGESVSIGRPQPNAVGLILDDYLRPVPVGVTGQLYLGGFGTARCYLNRPELTAAKFIAWPATGERIYQSGDLARWLSDGRVECLGRIDNQVKVRGFRVELGEVESALEAHPAVTQACVVVQDTHLVGYVCPPLSDDGQSILDHIRARLPHHMVPSALLGLPEFPRTRVGKIDRQALPPYDFTAASAATDLSTLAPTERQLIQVTADCLRLEPCNVGLDATFYQVGGNSLTAILLSSRCQALGLNLTVADFNRQGTFRQLARRSKATAGAQTGVAPADSEPEGPPRLLPGQHAFFSMPLANPNHMVIPVLFKASRVFPETAWQDAVRQIVQRHPMLQAQFHMDGPTGAMTYTVGQQPLPTYFGFDYQRVPDWSAMLARLPSLVQSLDYATGRLSTFHVFDLGPEQYFFYCVHHLASDYLSYQIFAADLTRLLLGQALQPPTATCRAWADRLYRATQNMNLTSLTLPPALPDLLGESTACCGPDDDGPGDVVLNHLVDADMTRDIVDLATDRLGATVLELLVTALYMAYRTVFALDTMGLAFVTHGRQPVGDVALDVSSTMGFFAHHVPVVITAPDSDDCLQTLRRAQQTLSTGIQDGLRLTLARYLRVFTDPAQQRPFQIDPPFLFSYLAPTQLTADEQGRQDLLQEQQDAVEVLRPYLVDLPFPFKVTASHDSNRLKLTVMGRRNGGYSALVERLLVAWTEALCQTVAMARDV